MTWPSVQGYVVDRTARVLKHSGGSLLVLDQKAAGMSSVYLSDPAFRAEFAVSACSALYACRDSLW